MVDCSQDPFGTAVQKQFQTSNPIFMKVSIRDVIDRDVALRLFFESPDEFLKIDKIALKQCRGRILDVGAGAGRFALPLQEQGMPVVAIERLPQAAAIMEARGVQDVRCIELDAFLATPDEDEQFDTILMMMNGLGIVGTLAKLEEFLEKIKLFVRPGGQILADSMDIKVGVVDDYSRHIAKQEKRGAYFGEIQLKFEFEGVAGAEFLWLHIDEVTLVEVAARHGWESEILYRGKDGTYLVCLTQL